jgi:hypothetical protein
MHPRIQLDNRTCGIAPTAPRQTTNLRVATSRQSGPRELRLSKHDASVPALLAQYEATRLPAAAVVERRLSAWRKQTIYQEDPNFQIERELETILHGYLREIAGVARGMLWLTHAAWLAFVVVLVRLRAYVGAALWWPFTLMFGAAKTGATAAKSLHERV